MPRLLILETTFFPLEGMPYPILTRENVTKMIYIDLIVA
jgi:hypothetical protein